MANIMLNKRATGQAENQLRRMRLETEAAQKKVMSAISGLDFEVASKQNIHNRLSKINTGLYKQISLSEQYDRSFTNVTDAIVNSDEKFGTESQSIIDKIKDFVDGVVDKISDFFFTNRMKKYAESAALFMPKPSVLKFWLMKQRLHEIAQKLKELLILPIIGVIPPIIHPTPPVHPPTPNINEVMEDIINNHDNDPGHTGTPVPPPITPGVAEDVINNNNWGDNTTAQPAPSTAPAGMKDYEGSSKDLTPNGYKDFNVVDGFDDSLVHSQSEYNTYYTNSQGQKKNGGCTSVSDSIVYALNHDTEFSNPENSWKNGMTYWTTQSIRSKDNLDAQARLNETYNQIVNNGKAVVFRVTNHSMAAVGIREGADPANVTPADILVCDSGPGNGGRICTLQEYLDKNPGRKVQSGSGYPLRV